MSRLGWTRNLLAQGLSSVRSCCSRNPRPRISTGIGRHRTSTAQLTAWETLEVRQVLAAGDKDTSFGTGGLVTTPITSTSDSGTAMALQSNGYIVVAGDIAGTTNNINTSSDFAVARYTPSGAIDTSFGQSGVRAINIGLFDRAKGIAIQSDGAIIVVGESTELNGTTDISLFRLNSDGSIDTTFGAGGIIAYDYQGGNDSAQAVTIQADGRILVGGYVTLFEGNSSKLVACVLRYNIDSSLDGSWGLNGTATTAFGSQADVITGIAVQPDQRVVVSVNSISNNIQNVLVSRYNATGTTDTSFGANGGSTIVGIGSGGEDYARGIVVMPIGRIVVGGYTRIDATTQNYDFFAARFNSEGFLDTTFDTDGVATAEIGSASDLANAVAVQRDGRIIVAGRTLVVNTSVFAMVRFNVNGTRDTYFGNEGIVTQSFANADSLAMAIAIQPADQRIILAGWEGFSLNSRDFALARFDSERVFPAGDPTQIVRMYRAYNPNADYHFFTTSQAEFENAVAAGYRDETTGRGGFSVRAGQVPGTNPIYRMYNVTNGRHYYTLDVIERDRLQSLGWLYEKPEGFMYTSQVNGTSTIYRLYNTNTGTHLYTESAGVKDTILASLPSWQQHADLGFAFIVTPGSPSITAPLIAEALPVAAETSIAAAAEVSTGLSPVTSDVTLPSLIAWFASAGSLSHNPSDGIESGTAELPVTVAPASSQAASRLADRDDSSTDDWTDSLDGLFAGNTWQEG